MVTPRQNVLGCKEIHSHPSERLKVSHFLMFWEVTVSGYSNIIGRHMESDRCVVYALWRGKCLDDWRCGELSAELLQLTSQ